MVSVLSNHLATITQLISSQNRENDGPHEVEQLLHCAGAGLIQVSGVLLRLPQSTIATAIVLIQKFYLVMPIQSYSMLHTCNAAIYISTKLTECPTKPRLIINATAYTLKMSDGFPLSQRFTKDSMAPSENIIAYGDEISYNKLRTRLLDMEGEILAAVGFQAYISLPYTLLINYAQALECLSKMVIKRAFGYLTDGLLSPCQIFLTHQPNSLATAALYLAAREEEYRLPQRWWEIFDVEREELGFLVAAMKSVPEFVERQVEIFKLTEGSVPWDKSPIWNGRCVQENSHRDQQIGA